MTASFGFSMRGSGTVSTETLRRPCQVSALNVLLSPWMVRTPASTCGCRPQTPPYPSPVGPHCDAPRPPPHVVLDGAAPGVQRQPLGTQSYRPGREGACGSPSPAPPAISARP